MIRFPAAHLTDEFLKDLYRVSFNDPTVFATVMEHMQTKYLPTRDFQGMHRALARYYKDRKRCPVESVLRQALSTNPGALDLVDELFESRPSIDPEEAIEQLEEYIKQAVFQRTYMAAGTAYNESGYRKAAEKLLEYAKWVQEFSLTKLGYVDVTESFEQIIQDNRAKQNDHSKKKPVNRFYIDELDSRNEGKDLRGQLTCFLASTGVGKSHVARYIGKNACFEDGLNVLHFQLEGSESETVNAYAASIAKCSAFEIETGRVKDDNVKDAVDELSKVKGHLYVKSFPKFNAHVSTTDIYTGIQDFKKKYKMEPDVVIIDSMDLLTDSSGRFYTEKGERLKRIAVANDLKDLASDEDVWMVVTYQSTIENQDWLNDERNVLSAYNTAEAKGLTRPLTHLITLNQSANEDRANVMRLYVAKSRFFKKGDPFKIATDYAHEQFYDRTRTDTVIRVDNYAANQARSRLHRF